MKCLYKARKVSDHVCGSLEVSSCLLLTNRTCRLNLRRCWIVQKRYIPRNINYNMHKLCTTPQRPTHNTPFSRILCILVRFHYLMPCSLIPLSLLLSWHFILFLYFFQLPLFTCSIWEIVACMNKWLRFLTFEHKPNTTAIGSSPDIHNRTSRYLPPPGVTPISSLQAALLPKMQIVFSCHGDSNLRYVYEAGVDNRTNLGIVGIDIQIFMPWFDILCSQWQRGEESHTNMFK